MTRTTRHSKRKRKKEKRRAKRKEARKHSDGQRAGSIAIHSRLPGLEGELIGSMDVVADTRRKEQHSARISIAIYQRAERQTVVWAIETGFGGRTSRAGFMVIPDGQLDQPPPLCWFPDIDSVEIGADSGMTIELPIAGLQVTKERPPL